MGNIIIVTLWQHNMFIHYSTGMLWHVIDLYMLQSLGSQIIDAIDIETTVEGNIHGISSQSYVVWCLVG